VTVVRLLDRDSLKRRKPDATGKQPPSSKPKKIVKARKWQPPIVELSQSPKGDHK
jgi:hypothetical protein